MLKITDFADRGGVDRLVYFVEEIWGTLHPDCGPNDLEAIEEEAAVVIAERDRLRRELEEAKASWRCYHCGKVFTDPVLAAKHFGENSLNPRPAACEGMLIAIAEAFERAGIHRNYHNAASVKQLANQRDAAQAEIARMRPVVEAVMGWRKRMNPETVGRMLDALDAYRASTGKGGE